MENYYQIKKLYGHCSSWAIWDKNYKKPKDNISNISFFTDDNIINKLNPNIIFVGLNISEKIQESFGNFHSKSKYENCFKLRYSLQDTILEGSYMTDIIKNFEEKESGNVMRYIRENPNFLEKNLKQFEEEIKILKTKNPIFVAFGNDTYKILSKVYKNVYKLPHYSCYISKENFKKKVEELLQKLNNL